MTLRLWRFSSIMFTAVTMSAAFAHLMELPSKMRYDGSLFVRLHRTLYPNFGRVAGIAEVLALVTTASLSWQVRGRRPSTFRLTAAAAGGLTVGHGIFWSLVHPANATIASWPLEAIPAEWEHWRNQWEYSHATRALLFTGALGTLVYSALRDTTE